MTQARETTQIANKNVVMNFLSALKAGATGQGGAKSDLFAAFLAESKGASLDVKAQPVAPQAERPVALVAAVDGQTRPVKAPEENREVQENTKMQGTHNEGRAPSVAKHGNEDKKENRVEENEPSLSQEIIASDESSQSAVSKEVEIDELFVVAKKVVTADESDLKEGDEVNEDLLALLAALNPLDETPKTEKSESATTNEESGKNEISAEAASLIEAELKTLLQARKEVRGHEDKTEKPQEMDVGGIKSTIEGALAVKAEQRALLEETAVLMKDENFGATEQDAKPFMALNNESFDDEGAFSKNGKNESTPLETDPALLTRRQGKEDAFSAMLTGSMVQDNVKKSFETLAGAQAKSAAVGDVGATNVLSGSRSAEPYTFASQLSAARVTKGGATGLPTPAEQIVIQVNKMAKEGKAEMTIHLKPAELGKVQVKLEFLADHKVQALVTADNQNALDLLMKDQNGLSRALTEAGLQVDAGGLRFALNENNQNKTFEQERFSNAAQTFFDAEDEELTAGADLETYYIMPGRVNLRV